jgi:hypothetical protein
MSNPKDQAPNIKYQITNKFQITLIKIQTDILIAGIWSLGFGIF